MKLEAIASHPIANYLGEETNNCLTITSFQVESKKVPPSATSSSDLTAPVPSAALHKTYSLDPSPALLPFFGQLMLEINPVNVRNEYA